MRKATADPAYAIGMLRFFQRWKAAVRSRTNGNRTVLSCSEGWSAMVSSRKGSRDQRWRKDRRGKEKRKMAVCKDWRASRGECSILSGILRISTVELT